MFGNVGGVIMMENFVLCSAVFQRQPSVKNKSLDLVCREENNCVSKSQINLRGGPIACKFPE